MKDINNFITEAVKFTDDKFTLYKGMSNKANYEYVIIFPLGGVEMYSKKALTDMIGEEDDWDDVDLRDTYIELSHIELQTPSGIIRYFPSQPVPHLFPSVSRILLCEVQDSMQVLPDLVVHIWYAPVLVMANME